MRQDAFDCRVVERKRQVHVVIASIIRDRADSAFPCGRIVTPRESAHARPPGGAPGHPEASERELVTTLFDLGRQVTSVLDFDELLRADSPADRRG